VDELKYFPEATNGFLDKISTQAHIKFPNKSKILRTVTVNFIIRIINCPSTDVICFACSFKGKVKRGKENALPQKRLGNCSSTFPFSRRPFPFALSSESIQFRLAIAASNPPWLTCSTECTTAAAASAAATTAAAPCVEENLLNGLFRVGGRRQKVALYYGRCWWNADRVGQEMTKTINYAFCPQNTN
jgi:hypothetical protein